MFRYLHNRKANGEETTCVEFNLVVLVNEFRMAMRDFFGRN